MDCTPQALMQEARCYKCIPPRILDAVLTYELATIAGGTMDPRELVREAAQFINCIPPGMQQAVQVKLLCDILDDLD